LGRVGADGQGLAHPLRVAVELGRLELEGESEQRNVAAAKDSHDGKSSRRAQPGR